MSQAPGHPSQDPSASDPAPPAKPLQRGRGATQNPSGRYENQQHTPFDDGWAASDEPAAPLRTEVRSDTARSVLSRNDSPDIPFDRSLNPYRGCEHGCVYCYARPSHAYLGHSPGLDFESLLYAKHNAAERLTEELAKPRYRCAPIGLGMNTDAWQPVERQLQITREVLQVLHDCQHPLYAVTKSALIERDLDLLSSMARRNQVSIYVSLTTQDRNLSRRMEPRAASPQRRLATIRALSEAGVPVGVLIAPIIPVLTDRELESLIEAAAAAGARSAGYVMLRLPHELPDLFRDWLQHHYPERATHVMKRVQDVRGGRDYEAGFGARMRGRGAFAEIIAQRFELARRQFGLAKRSLELDCSSFKPPSRRGDQLSLL